MLSFRVGAPDSGSVNMPQPRRGLPHDRRNRKEDGFGIKENESMTL